MRIVQAQPIRGFDAIFVRHQLVGIAQHRWPRSQVVGIGGDEINPIPPHQFVRNALRNLAKSPGEGSSGDLDIASGAQPVRHPLRVTRQHRVPLRVGNDRSQPGHPQAEKHFFHVLGNPVIGKLHQKVLLAIDGVL